VDVSTSNEETGRIIEQLTQQAITKMRETTMKLTFGDKDESVVEEKNQMSRSTHTIYLAQAG
jgi:hypothetical protein